MRRYVLYSLALLTAASLAVGGYVYLSARTRTLEWMKQEKLAKSRLRSVYGSAITFVWDIHRYYPPNRRSPTYPVKYVTLKNTYMHRGLGELSVFWELDGVILSDCTASEAAWRWLERASSERRVIVLVQLSNSVEENWDDLIRHGYADAVWLSGSAATEELAAAIRQMKCNPIVHIMIAKDDAIACIGGGSSAAGLQAKP